MHHGEGHIGLNSDDHRIRAAQAHHLRDVLQRAGGKGVHDVQSCHVDDHTMRAKAPHLFHERVAELHDVGVGQRRLDGRDEVGTLLEDWDLHANDSSHREHSGACSGGLRLAHWHHLVSQQALGLLDAPLEIAHRVHLPEVHTDVHECLGDLG